jgi:hypothetical protein
VKARPILAEIMGLARDGGQRLPKSALGEALTYLRNRSSSAAC